MEQQPRLPLWFLGANCALIAGAFVVGVLLGRPANGNLPKPQSLALQVVFDEVLQSHVEPQNGAVLLDRAIGAMVGSLDEYSEYVPPNEVAKYDERNSGRYEGVGMLMVQHGEDIVVHWPFPGGPAAAAGLLPGDLLIAIDGHRVDTLPRATRNEETSKLVRGPADSDVRLTIARDGGELERTVRRGAVLQRPVKWVHIADPDLGLGYLYVKDFHRGVAEEVAAAIATLQSQGPLRGLVIDLRCNGGGSLDECVTMARSFQPTGTIVSTRRRDQVVEAFEAKPEQCTWQDLPLVVLVNGSSASASEVFAGCLQDHGRAAIVGVRTFGKGFVNTVYTWKNLPIRLKLTTAHYFTPNGRNIERPHGEGHADAAQNGSPPPADVGGIMPDVEVPVTEAERRSLYTSLANAHEVPLAHAAAFAAVATKYGIQVPAPPRAADDPQLDKALATLRERIGKAGGK